MHTYLHSFLLTICYAFNASIDCTLLFTIKCTYCNSECNTIKRPDSDPNEGSVFSSISNSNRSTYGDSYLCPNVSTIEYSHESAQRCS